MCNLNFLLIISSVMVQAKCVGERENGFESKRFDLGLETCVENFDVHVDKIIRTQDSRAMGAKYLNEAEVNGRDECMKFCCETPTCDVFVFEQKVPGSCYLFHCGSPEDFKCKFTQHRNYTSAVLALNNRLSELENSMKLSKHEKELSMLRKLDLSLDTTTFLPLSTKVPAIPLQPKQNATKSRCSRYQFECRGSGECIAIYNACDGIPQCADGSDEAPELYCPTVAGTPHPRTFHEQLVNLKEGNENLPQPEKMLEMSTSTEPLQKAQQKPVKSSLPPRQHQSVSSKDYFPYGYSRQNKQIIEAGNYKGEPSLQMQNQPRYYGREGEIVQYPVNDVQWQGYQPQRLEENHKFSIKGSEVVPESSDSKYPVPYNNELNRAEYLKYAAAASGNGYYHGAGPVYYPGPNSWPQHIPQQLHGLDVPQRPMYGTGMSGSAPSDYYYEDSQIRGRFPAIPQEPRTLQNSDSAQVPVTPNESSGSGQGLSLSSLQQNVPVKHSDKADVHQEEPVKSEEPKKTESVKKTLENISPESVRTPQTKTTSAATDKQLKPSHEIAVHLKLAAKEADGINERPSGAILSLTLGLCITAIMITLVGCRLRVVRKRMRRNGKSPYAHDADFLVNGMYL